jgi:hypothetical protein
VDIGSLWDEHQSMTISRYHAVVINSKVQELSSDTFGTLAHYLETAVALTLVTIWIMIAFQSRFYLADPDASMWRRLLWPIVVFASLFKRNMPGRTDEEAVPFSELP